MRVIFPVIAMGLLGALIGGVAAQIGYLPAVIGPSSSPLAESQSDSDHDLFVKLAELRQEVAFLKAEINVLKQRTGELQVGISAVSRFKSNVALLETQPGQVSTAGTGFVADDSFPLTVEELDLMAEYETYEDEQRQQRLSARLQGEPFDPTWSHRAESHIAEIMYRDELQGTILEAVECRSSLCRLEVEFADPAAAGAFHHLFAMEVVDLSSQILYFHEPHGEDNLRTVMFLVRKDHELLVEELQG